MRIRIEYLIKPWKLNKQSKVIILFDFYLAGIWDDDCTYKEAIKQYPFIEYDWVPFK